MGRSICIGVAMLASLLVGERSALAILIFSSEADFLSSATIVSTETFDSFTPGIVFHDKVTAIGGVVYSTSACSIHCWGFAERNVTDPLSFGSPRIMDDIMSFGPELSASALGFFILANDVFRAGNPDLLITVTEVGGLLTDITISDLWPSGVEFRGFLSTVGIVSVNVRGSLAPNRTFDNVSRSMILGGSPVPNCTPLPQGSVSVGESCVEGVSPLISVPEPSTLSLFAIGLAGLGFMTRRRRSNETPRPRRA